MSAHSSDKKFDLEQLKRMGMIKKASEIKTSGSTDSQGIKRGKVPCSLKKIFPDGEFIDTPYRQVFKAEKVYPPDTPIGTVKISDFFKFIKHFGRHFAVLQKNENLRDFRFNKLLFFDVESTGLTSGAGNMAFMVGLGFFNEKKEFVILQYFIEDFINEKGLLFILEDFFKKKYHLVSFNGKSFDYYLLKNRFILSRRFTFTLDNLMHFDLLHSGRRMWKNMFAENTLNNLEKKVLKFFRTEDDIPGYLVPEFYKEYLKTGDARVVEKIFYHNLMDIRSMLGLLIVQLENLQALFDRDFSREVNYNTMASLIYGINKKLSIELLNHNYHQNKGSRSAVLKQMYLYYKRDNDNEKFQEILYKMINNGEEFDYFPYCELSKYFEHSLKKPEKAMEILNKARTRIDGLIKLYNRDFTKEIDEIIKRMARLQVKCSRK